MLDKMAVRNSLEELAERVESFDDQAAKRLRHLGHAVTGAAPADAWASSDIHRIIDPDLITEQYRSQKGSASNRFIQTLEGLRNVSIFVPIIVTWYGISQASHAYQELLAQCLKSCPDQVEQPFLYLWQQGFGGRLPPFLTLSSVGLIDAGILLFIFVLTFLVVSLSHSANQRQEVAAQQLHAELVHAISEATLCLHQKPPSLVTPIDNLDDVARRIETMAQNILSTFNTLAQNITQQFDTVTTQMGRQFSDVAGRFEQVATDLGQQVARTEQEFTRQLQESNKHLDTLGQLVGGTSQLAAELQTNADALKQISSELGQHLKQLITPLTDLAQQQQDMLDTMNQAFMKLDESTRELTELNMQTQKWVDTIETFEISIGRIDSVIAGMGEIGKAQKAFLTELQQERAEQTKLANYLNDATAGVKEALDTMHVGANSIRSIAWDIEEISRRLAALPNTQQMDVSGIINNYTSATQTITTAGRDLSNAVMIFYNAALSLKNIVSELQKRQSAVEL